MTINKGKLHLEATVDKKGHTVKRWKGDGKKKDTWADLRKYKLNVYPDPSIPRKNVEINTGGDTNSHWVMRWTNPKTGKLMLAYTPEFMRRNAELKWARVSTCSEEQLSELQAACYEDLISSKEPKIRQSAAVILILKNTGLRVGSRLNFGKTQNRGITTLSWKDVEVKGDVIKFNFIGKKYVENEGELKDRVLAKYIQDLKKEAIKNKSEFLFKVDRPDVDNVFKERYGFEEFKLKDFRTIYAGKKANEYIENNKSGVELTESEKKNRNSLKKFFKELDEHVSKFLNNTPAMARSSYIHPQIKLAFLQSIGISADEILNKSLLDSYAILMQIAMNSNLDPYSEEMCDSYPLLPLESDEDLEEDVPDNKIEIRNRLQFIKAYHDVENRYKKFKESFDGYNLKNMTVADIWDDMFKPNMKFISTYGNKVKISINIDGSKKSGNLKQILEFFKRIVVKQIQSKERLGVTFDNIFIEGWTNPYKSQYDAALNKSFDSEFVNNNKLVSVDSYNKLLFNEPVQPEEGFWNTHPDEVKANISKFSLVEKSMKISEDEFMPVKIYVFNN